MLNTDDDILDGPETMERLKIKSQRLFDDMVRSKKIPHIRISAKTIRFSWAAVREALQAFEVKAVSR